jgi:hypothetical protein
VPSGPVPFAELHATVSMKEAKPSSVSAPSRPRRSIFVIALLLYERAGPVRKPVRVARADALYIRRAMKDDP